MEEANEAIINLGGVTTESTTDTTTTTEQISSDDQEEKPLDKEVSLLKRRKIAQDKILLLAGTLVLDAKGGRNLEYILGEKYVRSYNWYNSFYLRWALYFCLAFNLSLALFEHPAVPGASIPYWGTMIMELVCLCYFAFRLSHAFYFQYTKVFFKDAKNICVLVMILLTILDMISYIVWSNVDTDVPPVRWSRPLRPLFIINFPDGKQIRRAFRNIRRTIPDIVNVLILFLSSVLLFGLFALKLFNKRGFKYPSGEPYFSNYFDSIWDLYVLVTTANNPDVMMPAYDESNWFALFFVIYLILCLYIFMSIVLATIYNNYKKNLKNEIKEAVFQKRKKLAKAFDLLKVKHNDQEFVSYSRWSQLVTIILPGRSETHTDLLMKILDHDNTNVLNKKKFLNLADLLQVQLTEVKDRLTLLEKHFPSIYNHRISEYFKFFVRHRVFRYWFDLLIIVNAVFIAIDLDAADWFFLAMFTVEILSKLYVLGGKEFMSRFWNIFDVVIIGGAFVATIIEYLDFDNKESNIKDILLVLRVVRLVKLFGSIKRFKVILQTLVNIGPSFFTYGGVIFVFYYFFAIVGMEIFNGYITFYGYDNETPDTMFCGNIKLNNSVFYREHYCNNNFNDILKSMVVMFELTVVNQWHGNPFHALLALGKMEHLYKFVLTYGMRNVPFLLCLSEYFITSIIASGFVAVTSKVARLYFFAFHLSCVVIILNIFTAFILEAFILEYTLQTVPRLESVVESKIKELGLGIGMKTRKHAIQGPTGDKIILVEDEETEGTDEVDNQENETEDMDNEIDLSKEKGLKFHLKKHSRKKTEVLLQQMFQGELGDDDVDDVETYSRERKLTLEALT